MVAELDRSGKRGRVLVLVIFFGFGGMAEYTEFACSPKLP